MRMEFNFGLYRANITPTLRKLKSKYFLLHDNKFVFDVFFDITSAKKTSVLTTPPSANVCNNVFVFGINECLNQRDMKNRTERMYNMYVLKCSACLNCRSVLCD